MRRLILATLLATGALVGLPGGPVVADPSCAGLGGTVEAAVCHVHDSTASYLLDMAFPVDYPDQQALTDYLTQNRDGFMNVVKSSGPRDMPYQMAVTSEEQRSQSTRSVVLKVFEDLGGPRPSNSYKSFNYDLDRGRPITFDTLFAPGSKPLDAIYPLVQRDVGRQNGLGAAILPGIGLDPSRYQNFAITDTDVIFYFAPGELLPPPTGAIESRVPRNAIPPLSV